ncbi:MAG: aminotransferase class V-fold PLP-dependent enzyme [Pseudomonadota bacterium]
MQLDLNFVRAQFDQLGDDPNFVFASNAGGSYVANQVNAVVEHYNRHTRVQPYERYGSSDTAGKAMDRARALWCEALNIDDDELTIGPSTSMNTYVLSQGIGATLKPGDEVIVTNQDHEANSGAWRRMAEASGATLREWQVEPDTGLLDPEKLRALLTENTRWVFFTHCSNIVGTANPVAELTAMIKQNSNARVFIDAVAYAPHCISDLRALGVDGYAFSLYKVYGPHQSLMYVKRDLHETLAPQCHFFNKGHGEKMFNPAGPQHAQVAACAGVIDYFSDLYAHHADNGDATLREKITAIHDGIVAHENTLGAPILDYLSNSTNARLIGKATTADNDRAPTIAFQPTNQSAFDVAGKMQQHGIGTESGNFYAYRLIRDLGIDPEDGVVRISLVHYSNEEEVEKIVKALDSALTQ